MPSAAKAADLVQHFLLPKDYFGSAQKRPWVVRVGDSVRPFLPPKGYSGVVQKRLWLAIVANRWHFFPSALYSWPIQGRSDQYDRLGGGNVGIIGPVHVRVNTVVEHVRNSQPVVP